MQGNKNLQMVDKLSSVATETVGAESAIVLPPLTTIRQPAARIGQEAVRILCEILAGNTAPVRSVMLPYDLVVRKSTAAPR